MIWDPGKKHSNQIQHPVLMKEFPTLQRAWHSLIPGLNIKGLISGVHKNLQLVGGVAK